MVGRGRRRSGLTARRCIGIVCAALLPGCSAILGIDAGNGLTGSGDASVDGTTVAPGERLDASGATNPEGAATVAEAVPGGGDAACETGTTCQCRREADWCTGRCGATEDNCGSPIDCGPCDAGACVEEPAAQACGARQCGQAVDNCGAKVTCGLLGLGICSNFGDVCLADGGCCAPNSGGTCWGHCGATVTDGCGRTVHCFCSPDAGAPAPDAEAPDGSGARTDDAGAAPPVDGGDDASDLEASDGDGASP